MATIYLCRLAYTDNCEFLYAFSLAISAPMWHVSLCMTFSGTVLLFGF